MSALNPVLHLNPQDNVAVALKELPPNTPVPQIGVNKETIPAGHKVALTPIAKGQPVYKYGQIIGLALVDIVPGQHVHSHNLGMGEFARDYAIGQGARQTPVLPENEQAHFQGIVRSDGRIGTRNYLGALSTVNCSASVTKFIAESLSPQTLAKYPQVDGVVALTHGGGCGTSSQVEGFRMLQRTLAGYCKNANFAGVLLVGLGCEVNHLDSLMENTGLNEGPFLRRLNIQEQGGTKKTVERGAAILEEMLPQANQVQRTPVPASHLVLGLECGGSDAYSGISANPALGAAVDLLVQHGGTAILSETPEIYGAEHLLTRRAASPEVAEKLIERIRWWEEYTKSHGAQIDNNPTPGNKAGGLTTILEKSLGAVTKGGTTNLNEVYQYAQPIKARGLVFMDTPGYDAVSITGMVAGGADLIAFSSGRGSVYGGKPVPSLKLATNTSMYRRLSDDMDVNCGAIVDGDASLAQMGERIFELLLQTASGKRTKSEELGMGDHEFVPWQMGAVV